MSVDPETALKYVLLLEKSYNKERSSENLSAYVYSLENLFFSTLNVVLIDANEKQKSPYSVMENYIAKGTLSSLADLARLNISSYKELDRIYNLTVKEKTVNPYVLEKSILIHTAYRNDIKSKEFLEVKIKLDSLDRQTIVKLSDVYISLGDSKFYGFYDQVLSRYSELERVMDEKRKLFILKEKVLNYSKNKPMMTEKKKLSNWIEISSDFRKYNVSEGQLEFFEMAPSSAKSELEYYLTKLDITRNMILQKYLASLVGVIADPKSSSQVIKNSSLLVNSYRDTVLEAEKKFNYNRDLYYYAISSIFLNTILELIQDDSKFNLSVLSKKLELVNLEFSKYQNSDLNEVDANFNEFAVKATKSLKEYAVENSSLNLDEYLSKYAYISIKDPFIDYLAKVNESTSNETFTKLVDSIKSGDFEVETRSFYNKIVPMIDDGEMAKAIKLTSNFLEKYDSELSYLSSANNDDEGELVQFISLFNKSVKFYDSHEVREDFWNEKLPKDLYNELASFKERYINTKKLDHYYRAQLLFVEQMRTGKKSQLNNACQEVYLASLEKNYDTNSNTIVNIATDNNKMNHSIVQNLAYCFNKQNNPNAIIFNSSAVRNENDSKRKVATILELYESLYRREDGRYLLELRKFYDEVVSSKDLDSNLKPIYRKAILKKMQKEALNQGELESSNKYKSELEKLKNVESPSRGDFSIHASWRELEGSRLDLNLYSNWY